MEGSNWKLYLLFMLTQNVCQKKMHSCQNNPEKSYTEKETKHTPSGCSIFTSCTFDPTKNKLDCYKGEDRMESFCKDLRKHAMTIMNYEKKRNDTING